MSDDPAAHFFPGDDDPDLYAALDLTSDATHDDIKKAYRRSALRHHPDRLSSAPAAEQEAAKLRFQQIGFAYAVLSDPKRKERFDKTGRTDEGFDGEMDWNEYFKELWTGEVNVDTIEEFKKKYQGSDEERADVLAAYTSSSGSLDTILTTVMLSEISDEPRFIALINDAISSNDVPSFPGWAKSIKDTKSRERRRKAAEKEAEEAEELAKELGLDEKLRKKGKGQGKGKGKGKGDDGDEQIDEEALGALIRQRGSQRMEALIGDLEAKYGGGGGGVGATETKGKKGGKRARKDVDEGGDGAGEETNGGTGPGKSKRKKVSEPSEEEFAKIQAEMDAKRSSRKSGRR